MKWTITVDLAKGELSRAIRDLKHYRDHSLDNKIKEFIDELASVGIDTARLKMADNRYKNYITFGATVEVDEKKHRVVLVYGRNTEMFERTWFLTATSNKRGYSEINPILMAEFGSGAYARTSDHINTDGIGGRGTHPTQRHAFDKNGWWWYEEEADPTSDRSTYIPLSITANTRREKHFSRGEVGARPLLAAVEEMQRQVRTIADKVFG